MPPLDEGSLLFMPVTDPAVSLAQNTDIARRQNDALMRVPEVEYAVAKVGRADTSTDPSPLNMTETIVHLYEELGADCIEQLDGMFGLAIWDEPEGRLILARDRAGKKPLFYDADGSRVLFASEMKAFLGHPSFTAEVDRAAVAPYFLYGYVPGPKTWYRGVRQVEPGGMVVFDRGGASQARKYWTLTFPEAWQVPTVSRPEATARVRELVVVGRAARCRRSRGSPRVP